MFASHSDCSSPISTAVRAIGATAHLGPTLYPDEYIYTALSRSLATSGRPLIRGQVAHFPALLDPLLAAPLWAIAPAQVAYHLVQVENALFMSLAAIPVYLLARALDFRPPYSLVCAAFAVAIPDLAYAGRTLADPIAYPLALAALYAAVVALQKPTARRQIAFLVLAALATFARVEYVVLVPAFVGALLVTRRRQSLTTHRLTLAAVAIGAALALSLGPARVLGYYKQVVHLHLGTGLAAWVGNDMFLLAVAGGTVLVPGALVGLAKARGRRDASFSVLAVLYALAIFFAAGLYASNGAARFQERYLLTLLPLIPLAFGLYLPPAPAGASRGRRHQRGPVRCEHAAAHSLLTRCGLGSIDSPLLWASRRLDPLLGTRVGSLLFAAFIALRRPARDRSRVRGSSACRPRSDVRVPRRSLGPGDVVRLARREDRHDAGEPDMDRRLRRHRRDCVSTPLAPGIRPDPAAVLEPLSRDQELLLPGAVPTDAFAVRARADRPRRDAAERATARSARQCCSANARRRRLPERAAHRQHTTRRTLAAPRCRRLALLEQGRFEDGWLVPSGSLTLWPEPGRIAPGRRRIRRLAAGRRPGGCHRVRVAATRRPSRPLRDVPPLRPVDRPLHGRVPQHSAPPPGRPVRVRDPDDAAAIPERRALVARNPPKPPQVATNPCR